MKGPASLDSSFYFEICNDKTKFRHIKGGRKSVQSRQITGENRKVFGERVADMTYPSKLYHRKLPALDDGAFEMGNLKEVPQSKNVLRQCGYEYRKGNRTDESLMTSLKSLKLRPMKS